jgi:hypothetical protein
MLASGTAERARPHAERERGSPLPPRGVRGLHLGKFFKLHMATDAF